MNKNTLSKLKAPALSEFLHSLVKKLKEDEAKGEDGVFDGETFESLLGVSDTIPETAAEQILYGQELIMVLDSLSIDDVFGTEGWRHRYLDDED